MNNSTSAAPVLAVRGLRTQFETDAGVVPAVRDVSFDVGPGEILGLVGESGSGKSVTGYSIMQLVDAPGRVVGGEVMFQGRNLLDLPEPEMRKIRGRQIAMIFQDPMMTLNPVLRIEIQMVEAILAHEKVSKQAARARARDALALVGVSSPEQRLRAFPHQFSGGMRQRVAIAIAMLHRPALVIADEPTTALDVTIQSQILSEVQELARQTGTAFIWITHDLSVVAGLADRIAVMYAGQLVEEGAIDAVLDSPQHPYTAGLIGSVPSHNRRGEPLRQIPGSTPSLKHLPPGCSFRTRCERASSRCMDAPALEAQAGRSVRCFHPREVAL